MFGIAILLFIGSLIQLFFSGGTLGFILITLSGILLLSTLPIVRNFILSKSNGKDSILLKVLPIILLVAYLVSGVIFYPFAAEREIASNYNKAISFYSQQNYQKSLEIFSELEQKNPSDSQILLGMGLLYMDIGDDNNAWNYLNRAYTENPYDLNILYNLAFNRYHAGSIAESLQRFESLSRINPELIDVRLYAGITSMELGNYPRGRYHLEQAIIINPEIPEIYYYLGKCHQAMMEYEEAGVAFNRALELGPVDELKDILKIELDDIQSYLGGEEN